VLAVISASTRARTSSLLSTVSLGSAWRVVGIDARPCLTDGRASATAALRR